MFSPATVRAPAERSRRRAICSDAGLEAPRRNRLRRRARNDPRCGFVDDGLSATGPLAVEKSDDFPTAQPFAHKLHSAPIICIEIILEDTKRMQSATRRSPNATRQPMFPNGWPCSPSCRSREGDRRLLSAAGALPFRWGCSWGSPPSRTMLAQPVDGFAEAAPNLPGMELPWQTVP